MIAKKTPPHIMASAKLLNGPLGTSFLATEKDVINPAATPRKIANLLIGFESLRPEFNILNPPSLFQGSD